MLPASTTSLKSAETKYIDIGIDGYDEIESRFDALEKELEHLYGQALFGLHTLDAQGTFLSTNTIELAWLGYAPEEVIGRLKFIDVLTTDSRERYKCYLDKQLKSGAAENIDLALIGKNNIIKNVSLYSNAVFDSEGVLTKYRAVLFNIDERKSMETQLTIAATAFESQQGIMVTDANGVILQVNRAFTAITGYSAEEAIGKTPRLINSGLQDKSFYSVMWKSLINKGSWEGEITNRRKDGDVYPEHITITAVKDASGLVINYVATFSDISLSRAASAEIISLEFYDPLTQLANRRLLLDRLKQAMISSSRSGLQGALLFLDLDHFKTLNDTLGHDVGDLLLGEVARRLTSAVREGDTVARIGGDEFAVLLENLSEHTIEAAALTKEIAEKIVDALMQQFNLDTYNYQNTCSIGVTLFNGHALLLDEIMKQVEIAMYQSKNEGRNTLRFFDPAMQEAINSRVDLERELRKAIEQEQFELYYQAQVGSSGEAIGAEALIRWIHQDRGMISPLSFISLAEDTGQILPIGQWVLNAACLQLKAWQKSPATRDLVLAVNVSASQFRQVDFVEKVLEIIERHEVNPKQLKLELTESMLVNNISDIINKMEVLNKIGIRFSLDDFGTGYSSLQYLKKLPINQLKIDQSFVRDIATDASDRAIVRTIITIAQSLDINVIAEGVETAEQKQYLFDNGCTHYQGYLFGKPMPLDMFEASLRKI